jgi:hypothetical protein
VGGRPPFGQLLGKQGRAAQRLLEQLLAKQHPGLLQAQQAQREEEGDAPVGQQQGDTGEERQQAQQAQQQQLGQQRRGVLENSGAAEDAGPSSSEERRDGVGMEGSAQGQGAQQLLQHLVDEALAAARQLAGGGSSSSSSSPGGPGVATRVEQGAGGAAGAGAAAEGPGNAGSRPGSAGAAAGGGCGGGQQPQLRAGGYSNLDSVLAVPPPRRDKMESFWVAETLKYLYLIFAEPPERCLDESCAESQPDSHADAAKHHAQHAKHGQRTLVSLKTQVFNTEAHPLPVVGPREQGGALGMAGGLGAGPGGPVCGGGGAGGEAPAAPAGRVAGRAAASSAAAGRDEL